MREALAHVLWIGGAPRCGKTTLSRLLAERHRLHLYNLDWHQARGHRERFDPRQHRVSPLWEALSMDERWVLPMPDELFARAILVWTEMFSLVMEDLLRQPRDRLVVAEGPGAFPWCVAPLISSPRQAIWLVPTPAFFDRVLAARRAAGAIGVRESTSDPDRAERNLRDRDLLLAAYIQERAAQLALTCLVQDDTDSIEESAARLEWHFAPLLEGGA